MVFNPGRLKSTVGDTITGYRVPFYPQSHSMFLARLLSSYQAPHPRTVLLEHLQIVSELSFTNTGNQTADFYSTILTLTTL